MTEQEREVLFQDWLDRHLGLILKVVRASPAPPHDREDLFQEIMLQLWDSIPGYRREAKETTWIYRVAFNTQLAWKRREKRLRTSHEFLTSMTGTGWVAPDQSVDQAEVVERIYAAIRALPDVDSSLALMCLDGLSYREMADVLGISENLVGVKLHRIRKFLTDRFKEPSHEL